jgi:hypothetical protein
MRRFHVLRHAFGSLSIRHFDSVTVQAMVGHSRLATTERYLHAKPRTDDAARHALLLGRVTYEAMQVFWPTAEGEFADRLNEVPKYVVSRR